MFVPVEDGEFVVVTHTDDAIVLPRAPRFTNKRDFYEFYQDYYHCPNPGRRRRADRSTCFSCANGEWLDARIAWCA